MKNGDGKINICLHFGFPKTGSSTLQFGLFKPLEDSYNLNLLTWRKHTENEHLDRRPSSRLFNFQDIDREYLNFYRNKINIFSDESFTAPLRLRKLNYGPNIRNPFQFPLELKKQIESLYPKEEINYKVFITIRNQSKLIFSQYVEEYNWKIFKNIDLLFNEEGEIDVTDYDIYNFYKYISILNEIFGDEVVTMTLFEDWNNEFDLFCSSLENVFNIPFKNISDALRRNHVNAKQKTKDGVFSKEERAFVPYLSDFQNHQIMENFYDSNLKLAELFGLHEKLKKYNYIL